MNASDNIKETCQTSVFERLTSQGIRWYASGSIDGNYLFELPDSQAEDLLTKDWNEGMLHLEQILEYNEGAAGDE